MESGERRLESASRAIDFGDDATNFLIKRLVAEVSFMATVGIGQYCREVTLGLFANCC